MSDSDQKTADIIGAIDSIPWVTDTLPPLSVDICPGWILFATMPNADCARLAVRMLGYMASKDGKWVKICSLPRLKRIGAMLADFRVKVPNVYEEA